MGKKLKGLKITGYVSYDLITPVVIGAQPDKGAAEFFDTSKTHFGILQRYNDIDVTFDIFGKGFRYPFADVPTSGTIKKVEISLNGSLALAVEHLNLDALDAVRQWQKQDPFTALGKLLKGNDTIIGSDFDDPSLWGGKGNDRLFGKGGADVLDGSKGNDLNDGGLGNDLLKDTKGDDTFQFSTPLGISRILNLVYNYDTIQEVSKGDEIYLSTSVFGGIGSALSKAEFHYGAEATTPDQRILFDGAVGYWDRDGSGTTYEAIPFFEVKGGAQHIDHKTFVMGAMYDGY